MKTITLKIITPLGIEKKIEEKEKFIIFFTENAFHHFKAVQDIFFKKNIGWVVSGRTFLNLKLIKSCFALFYNGEVLMFEQLDNLHYDDEKDAVEEYIFSPIEKRKKLFI